MGFFEISFRVFSGEVIRRCPLPPFRNVSRRAIADSCAMALVVSEWNVFISVFLSTI